MSVATRTLLLLATSLLSVVCSDQFDIPLELPISARQSLPELRVKCKSNDDCKFSSEEEALLLTMMFFTGPLVTNGCICDVQLKSCVNQVFLVDELQRCEKCSSDVDCPGDGNSCRRTGSRFRCYNCLVSAVNKSLESCTKATCTITPTPARNPGELACRSHKDCTLVNDEPYFNSNNCSISRRYI